MSVLRDEKMDAFALALNETGESVGVQTSENPVITQPAHEAEQDVSTDHGVLDTDVVTESSTEPNDEGHAVPYGRFKSVNDQRKQLQQEVESYRNRYSEVEQQLETLRTQQVNHSQPQRYEAPQQDSADDAWLDSLLTDEIQSESPNPDYQNLEERLQNFEVRQAEVDLQREMISVQREFPNVPDDVLLNAVISDPEINVRDVASQYSNFIANIEEEAISKYVERTGNKRAVAPRPKTTSGGTTARSHARGADEKITLSNARDKLYEAIKSGKVSI